MEKVPKEIRSSTRMITLMLVISTLVVGGIIVLETLFFRHEVKALPVNNDKSQASYEAYYALVVEETEDLFWQNVYKAAKEEGKKQHIFVELVGDGLVKDYSVEDKFRIALASKVDGIMVAPQGENMEELLDEAAKAEVPVVTLLDDCLKGERESFVGVNSTDIAKLYVETIGKLTTEDKKKVMILIDADDQISSKNMMCLNINEALSAQGYTVEIRPINRQNTFSAEELIRDIILNDRKIPDVLICLNTEDTLCAYQAVIDYNKVGNVAIMGYYQSDTILEGIEKHIIDTTLSIDSEGMGIQGVEALSSFRADQQVNAYFTVGVSMIDHENVAAYMKSNEKGE